jgi:hypothetical protein
MLSYGWGKRVNNTLPNQTQVQHLQELLKKSGFRTWLDLDHMMGSLGLLLHLRFVLIPLATYFRDSHTHTYIHTHTYTHTHAHTHARTHARTHTHTHTHSLSLCGVRHHRHATTTGNMDMVMAGAIEKSAAVIVCASPDYITGVNAQKEWMYVRQPAT